MIRRLAHVVTVLLLCCGAPAQELLWQRVGQPATIPPPPNPPLQLGGKSAFLGDIDADGFEDVLHGALVQVPGVGMQGQLLWLSGKNGATLRSDIAPPFGGTPYHYVSMVGGRDADGDGVLDYAARAFVTGSGGGPVFADVRSGKDGTILSRVSGSFSDDFGYWLCMADLDGDRLSDLLVAAPREAPGGAVHAYDRQGRLLYKISAKTWGEMGVVGDLDLDGCDDFVAGIGVAATCGDAVVYSGKTGSVITVGHGSYCDGLGTGYSIGCGDIDFDGVPDFVSSSNGSWTTPGVVTVFSSTRPVATPIYTWRTVAGSSFGQAIACRDLDLDGMPDLLVSSADLCGCHGSNSGAVYWLSLRDFGLTVAVYPLNFPSYTTGFGQYMAIGAPQPAHPFPVFFLPEPLYQLMGQQVGRVTMYRAAPKGIAGLGSACSGTLSVAPRMGLTDLGAKGVRLHLSSAPAGASAALLLGVSRIAWGGQSLPWALDPLGFTGCTLQTSVELVWPVTLGTTGANAGYGSVDLPLSLATGQAWATLQGQWLVLGAGPTAPGALSGGLAWQH